jgi:hypothetical protein
LLSALPLGWQSYLSASYRKLGNVLVAKGNLDDALAAYRDSVVIAERLAAADRNNPGWQRDLSNIVHEDR